MYVHVNILYMHVCVQVTVYPHCTCTYTCTYIYVCRHVVMCNMFLRRPTWVKIDDITYKKPCTLLLGVEDEYPQYGKLTNIYVVHERILFKVILLKTSFISHFHAFAVSPTSTSSLLLHTELLSPFPSHIHSVHLDNSLHSLIIPKSRVWFIVIVL